MALTVISRPSKEIGGKVSSWNALNLPVQYKFDSDLFPVNSVDAIFSIASFSNNGGFLQVELSVDSINTLEGEYVSLSSVDVPSYNGAFRIKTVIDAKNFVLYISYNSDITVGDFQKYYNNYFSEVKVYGGLPSYHPDYLAKPIQEVGILRLIPDTSNSIVASFSGIIKDDVSSSKQLSTGIDLDHFTGFYVEFREGYDKNVNDDIVTFFTSWETDQVGNCGVDNIINGDFNADLSNWDQIDAGIPSQDFVWVAGKAESNLNTYRKSKVLYQQVDMIADVEYNITVDVTRSNSRSSTFVIYGSNDLSNFFTLYSEEGTAGLSLDTNIVPSNNYKYICFHFFRAVTPVTTTLTLDNISFTPTVCEFTFWGSNSALQFQNSRGGNMYNNTSGRVNSEFMTSFVSPTIFKGNYFDLSIILNNESIDEFDISTHALMWLNGDDLPDGALIDSWLDRTGNHTITSTGTQRPISTDLGVNGRRGALFSGGSLERLIVSSMSIDQPCVLYAVLNKDSSAAGTKPVISDNSGASLFVDNVNAQAFAGGSSLSAAALSDVDHVLKVVFNGLSTNVFVDNVLMSSGNVGASGFNSAFYTIGYLSATGSIKGVINEIIILDGNIDPCISWQTETYLGKKYGTYTSGDVGFTKKEIDAQGNELLLDNGYIPYTGKGVYRIGVDVSNELTRSIQYKLVGASVCDLSEQININVNNECSDQEIYLTWLNGLDGWDYWKFTSDKSYNIDINSKETIKRSVFADWDNTFINGTTENDVISIDANKSIDVFSQYLNDDEIEAVGAIKYSSKVMMIINGVATTVIVDDKSITLYDDGEDETLHTIRFNIRLPDIQIQSQ